LIGRAPSFATPAKATAAADPVVLTTPEHQFEQQWHGIVHMALLLNATMLQCHIAAQTFHLSIALVPQCISCSLKHLPLLIAT
jgi:hypothetical protein